jgi:hypothetical protein
MAKLMGFKRPGDSCKLAYSANVPWCPVFPAAPSTVAAAQRGACHRARLEDQGGSYQLVDANTGTQLAADWVKGGYGLSLDTIEKVLTEP